MHGDPGQYSVVTLAPKQLLEQQTMALRNATWYAKETPTFSDTIALLRRSIWGAQIDDWSGNILSVKFCSAR